MRFTVGGAVGTDALELACGVSSTVPGTFLQRLRRGRPRAPAGRCHAAAHGRRLVQVPGVRLVPAQFRPVRSFPFGADDRQHAWRDWQWRFGAARHIRQRDDEKYNRDASAADSDGRAHVQSYLDPSSARPSSFAGLQWSIAPAPAAEVATD